MGVEHIHTGVFVAEFKDATLSLSLDDRICKFTGDKACAGGVIVEEIRVKMEGVDQIKLKDVHQINAYLLTDVDLYRMVLIVKGNSIDRIKVVPIIEINIDAMHHHDHFAVNRRPSFFGINNERAVESFCDVPH